MLNEREEENKIDFFSIETDLGVQHTEILDDDFANPKTKVELEDVTKVEPEEKKKTKQAATPKAEEEEEEVQLTEDDLLDDDGEVEVPKTKVKATPVAEEVEEPEEDNNFFAVFGNGLVKLGEFEEVEEDFQWTEETFLEKFKEEKLKGANDIVGHIISQRGEEYADFFDKVFIKGVSPKEYLESYTTQTSIESLKLEDSPANQERVVHAYYHKLGWEDDEINEHIEMLKTSMKLESESKKFQTRLVGLEQKNREALAAKAEAETQAKLEAKRNFEKAIASNLKEALTKKEIDGLPISKKEVDEIFHYVTAETYEVTKTGETLTQFDYDILELKKDPKLFLKLAKMVKSKLNLDPVKKKAVTEESNFLFNKIKTERKQKSQNEDPFLK
jgi:hypothetical protein